MRTIGGTSMRYVVMSNFSMSGRGGTKPAFEGLPIAKLISTAALRAAEKAGLSATGTAVKKSIHEHNTRILLVENQGRGEWVNLQIQGAMNSGV